MAPPYLLELISLAILVAILVALGALIRRRWSVQNEPVPVPVAVGSWAIVVLVYSGFAAFLIFSNPDTNPFAGIGDDDQGREGSYETHLVVDPDGTEREVQDFVPSGSEYLDTKSLDRRIQPLVVYGFLGLLCVAYYTLLMVNTLSERFVERIDPFSARIEDPSEFSEARKMALRGDIDGAVRMYRSYTDKSAEAQFEAARLLKSHDRFAEAAELLGSIAMRFYGNHVIWADATYQLAKLYDNHLDQPDKGGELLRQILQRAPETRFGQLASNEMARLRVLTGIDPMDNSDNRYKEEAPPKPAPGTLRQYDEPIQVQPRKKYEDEDYAPNIDPFFARRYGVDPDNPDSSDDENTESDTEEETQEDA